MIRLPTTTTKLQAVLAAAVTANQLQITAHYSDHTASAYAGGLQRSLSNSTTDVDIVDAPAASTVRDIDYISIYNADTVAAAVTVKLDVSGTEHVLVKRTLAPGDTLEYVHGTGWRFSGQGTTVGGTGAYTTYAGTATAGQATISGLSYTPGSVELYVNGVRQLPEDYTATNGTSIVLDVAMAENDEYQVIAWNISTGTGVVPLTVVESAGDLVVGTGAGTVDNLPVGDEGQILVANPNESAGMAWTSKQIGKNAIINGAFDVWQRGTSFASAGAATYNADRWLYSKSGAVVHDVSRSTDVPTVAAAGVLANYSLLADVTTADASIAASDVSYFRTAIEGYVWRHFAQRALTLSFWVKSTKQGTFCVSLVNGGADRSYVAEFTVDASDTWEKKTIQFPASPSGGTWDYTTGVGAYLFFSFACGTDLQTSAGAWQTGLFLATANQVNGTDSTANNFRLALMQLEVGDVATDFEIEAFDQTLQRCERYYQTGDSYDSSIQSFTANAGGQAFYTNHQFRCRMRTNPTVNISSGSMSNFATPVVNAAGDTAFGWYVTSSAAGIGYAAITYTANADFV